tara:strand:- start:122 stop:1024 length:903 start_codon:yes stop_codon:yes gene_type:complete
MKTRSKNVYKSFIDKKDMNNESLENEMFNVENKPIFTERSDYGFTLDKKLSRQLSKTLNKIKGRLDSEISEAGELEINEYIRFKVDKKARTIQDFNIFEEETEINGIDITLLIDCSGSMRGLRQKLADLSATLIDSMENSSFINFKVIAFSAKWHSYQSVLEIIDTKDKAGRIHADEDDLHDNHSLAIDFTVKDILKSNSDNKKLIVLITDGYPEAEYKGERVDSQIMINLMVRSVTEAKNQKVPIFCIYYGHISSSMQKIAMEKMFRGMLFESEDFNKVQKMLIRKLTESIEKLNQGGM